MSVSPQQRFRKRTQDCPICGGNQDDRRRRSERCYGFLSDDGAWAHCTREEYAGALDLSPGSGTYAHRLDGPCRCGVEHGTSDSVPNVAPRSVQRTPTPPPMTRTHQRHPPIAVHEYREADGRVRFRVARFWSDQDGGPPAGAEGLPKCLPQRPDGSGDWLDGLDGMPYDVLYRLPELLAAPAQRPVFVPEGEKAVDALAALGLVATTNAGGALKWQPDYNAALAGRHVVILPDADEKGTQHAQQVTASLAGHAASIRVVTLPGLLAKGDVCDWLTAGGSALSLVELAVTAPLSAASTANATQDEEDGEPDPRAPRTITEQHNRTLERQDAWDRKWRANPHVPALYKPVGAQVVDQWTHRSRYPCDEAGYLHVSRTRWGKRLGVTPKRVSQHLAKLAEAGAIERRYTTTFDEQGTPHKHLAIKPTETFLRDPDTITLATGWGGRRTKRLACPDCGHVVLPHDLLAICQECGGRHRMCEWRDPDAPDYVPPITPEQASTTAPAQERCPRTQDGPWEEETGDSGKKADAKADGEWVWERDPETERYTRVRPVVAQSPPPGADTFPSAEGDRPILGLWDAPVLQESG